MITRTSVYKLALAISIAGAIFSAIGLFSSTPTIWHAGLVVMTISFAIGSGKWPGVRSYQFTLFIIAGFVAAMIYSKELIIWGGFNITNKWIVFLVIQATMFSMGTKLTIKDFAGVAKMPWAVFAGTLCHFTIMPLLGYSLTLVFGFPPEIAVGIILIGSCASGLSSTVMVYIANANLALSVSVTAVSTLFAAIMTPLWVHILAGSLVQIDFISMIIDVIKIVMIPVGAAVLHDYIHTYASVTGKRVVKGLAVLSVVWLVIMIFGGWDSLFGSASKEGQDLAVLVNFIAGGIIWSLFYTWLTDTYVNVKSFMPRISMLGIIFFTTTAAAAGRDNLVQVGGLLCVAMFLHNIGGYIFGYLVSRHIFRLDPQSCRTIAFEVGIQNGGMASGLAAAMGKLATVGLASAVMTPMGNVTGSLLANYWRRLDLKKRQNTTPSMTTTPNINNHGSQA